jgi:titin
MWFTFWLRSGLLPRWHRWLHRLTPALRRQARRSPRRKRLLLEALEDRCLLSTYTVTSTADSGANTLRDAITQVNNSNTFITEIDFKIGAGGSAQTITLSSALPAITQSVYVNGLTQGGSGNTVPLITVTSGASISDGLQVSASNCTVSGLIIEGFTNAGLEVSDSTNTIGGTAAGAGNVLSGNSYGLEIDSNISGVQVQGNLLGTNATGTAALPNIMGILANGNLNTIGGSSVAGAGNLISGNTLDGIYLNGSGNVVQGNMIGLNASGTVALANSAAGIEESSFSGNTTSNTIGGTTAATRNYISGNGGDGIVVDQGVSSNLVEGNYIGLNTSGGALGNNGNGIEIAGTHNTLGAATGGGGNAIEFNAQDGVLLDSSSNSSLLLNNNILSNALNGIEVVGGSNQIGAAVPNGRNIISLNGHDGILIDSGASGNEVYNNYIGTDARGAIAKGNGDNGVEINSNGNVLGNTTPGAKNVISANGQDGVLLGAGATDNSVIGDYIGTNASGTSALGNSLNGIEILAASNTIGGLSSTYRNIISGNIDNGVLLGASASANVLEQNFIGTNLAGNAALANSGDGIEVFGSGNTLGGPSNAARNVISGNALDGIALETGSSGTVIESDYIGLAAAGTAGVGNGANGIEILASNYTIGGTSVAARNVISANANDGVLLGSGISNVQIQDCYVGTNAAGTAALGNSSSGIEVAGTANTIGGTTAGQRNLVSGNLFDGILLDGGATGNQVQGNYVGTTSAGTAALANGSNGVEVDGVNNTVGGVAVAARNVISGNFNDGVLVGASGVAVQGNFIGTTNAGTAALANGTGVEVAANNAIIGGSTAAARNIISGNSGDGVLIDGGVTGTTVQGNYLGVNAVNSAAVANGGYGVNNAGSSTLIGGTVSAAANVIADNTTGGVNLSAGSGNTVRYNSIYANGPSHVGPGITLAAGANNNLAAPTLSTATLSGTTLTATGSFTAPTANLPYVLEFFVSPAGDPEGKIYVGKLTVTPTSTGTQLFTFKASTAAATSTTLITATLTDSLGDTTVFSKAVTS